METIDAFGFHVSTVELAFILFFRQKEGKSGFLSSGSELLGVVMSVGLSVGLSVRRSVGRSVGRSVPLCFFLHFLAF